VKNTVSPRATWAHRLIALAFAALAVALWTSVPAFAQAAADTATTAAAAGAASAQPTSPTVGGDILAALSGLIPGWLVTTLSIFGTISIGYQALIAFAHQRAAATTDDADDKWIAALEAKAWFRVLDKIFYWGGYLGAKLGGKKL
jgi:hypothetical protein